MKKTKRAIVRKSNEVWRSCRFYKQAMIFTGLLSSEQVSFILRHSHTAPPDDIIAYTDYESVAVRLKPYAENADDDAFFDFSFNYGENLFGNLEEGYKTPEEMADQFHFDADQREKLAELLSDEYRTLWNTVLFGIGIGDDDIVAVALSQVGNVGGQPYWSWYGFPSRVEWCVCFVSWCAEQCGYIEAGIIPKFAGCPTGEQWFKDRGQWADRNYLPNPGDIIFLDWASDGIDGLADHVGIVERCEGGVVYTVEGNMTNSCKQRQYTMGYYEICGYGVPPY